MTACFCGRSAPWIVAVVANEQGGGVNVADDAWPACDVHVGLVALNLIKNQGTRPRHQYRLVLRGPEIVRSAPASAADDVVALEVFTCPACGDEGSKLAGMTEGFCGHCAAWTWPPERTGSPENRPR